MGILNLLRRILGPLVSIVAAILQVIKRSPDLSVGGRPPALPGNTGNITEPTTTKDEPIQMVVDDTTTTPIGQPVHDNAESAIIRKPQQFFDRRSNASKKHDYGKREWSKVTGICLHQTACVLGEKPPRWDTVGCHIGVTRSGKVIWLHDFNRLVVHGNGWNTQTVGIEIDGLYAGVEGDPKTVWDDPSTTKKEVGSILTQESIDATQQVIRFIADEIEKNGGKLKAIVAHRQASENRRNDPGSAIWKAIALPMAKELETSDGGPGFKLSKGYAIPESWDPSRKGIKY